jgi:hypothetical protein
MAGVIGTSSYYRYRNNPCHYTTEQAVITGIEITPV